MTTAVAFQTRARTVEHLGRGQIADTPTAISELWKNAYDAYATRVALHIFDTGEPGEQGAVAAIVDNGHGMSREEFVERWLVLGTETKLTAPQVPAKDRNGILKRARQGQKGIGRLSVARLGPLTLVLTKRRGEPLTMALVDWRLFENPFLNLEDVLIPVNTLKSPSVESISSAFAKMADRLYDNVSAKLGSEARNKRVNSAWKAFDALVASKDSRAPSELVGETLTRASVTERYLKIWDAWQSETAHGTALYVMDIDHELAVWTHARASAESLPKEAVDTKTLLTSTLTRFTDIFADRASQSFEYSVCVHRGAEESVIVRNESDFGIEGFHGLEHYVEGRFDEHGVFRGVVRAFGRAPEPLVFTPVTPLPASGVGYVGPLDVLVGTFEQAVESSTHPPIKHADLLNKANSYSGIALYRDGLRIMPYGRPNSDLFELEERRSQHAGREFWSHRRTFGRVAFSQADNPNLRDKAGREGLIDNQARRELKQLIIELLKDTARKHFGYDSEPRAKYLPEIEARNKLAKDAETKVSRKRLTVFRAALKRQEAALEAASVLSADLQVRLATALRANRADALLALDSELAGFRESTIPGLKLPPKPARLPGKLEPAYRSYRDRYSLLRELAAALYESWSQSLAKISPRTAEEQARSAFGRHQKYLHDQIATRLRRTKDLLKAETQRWEERASVDRSAYYVEASPFLDDLARGKYDLRTVLSTLHSLQETYSQTIESTWDAYIRALEHLAEGIDIDEALRYSTELREQLEERVAQVHSLAQLGVVVEIIGHELNDTEEEISRNMKRLPQAVRSSLPFRAAVAGQQRLFDQLRFLAPMLLAGRRPREEIRGTSIFAYVQSFFSRLFDSRNVAFAASPEFLALSLTDYPSRIQPVFLNLVNNALYWLSIDSHLKKRTIQLAVKDGAVVVADSGPGVDVDDVARLFQLFFSRKPDGRGIGLYLCRTNLEMGGHSIEYVTDSRHKVLGGANFAIRFKGAFSQDGSNVERS